MAPNSEGNISVVRAFDMLSGRTDIMPAPKSINTVRTATLMITDPAIPRTEMTSALGVPFLVPTTSCAAIEAGIRISSENGHIGACSTKYGGKSYGLHNPARSKNHC